MKNNRSEIARQLASLDQFRSTDKKSNFGIGEAGKVSETTPQDEIDAERLQPTSHERLVKCSCGHTVPASWVMAANLGSSCPDCYDQLSD
jgi:hypothetical protein